MPAQDYTKWKLPKGAKNRLGKGRINEIKYSSDSRRLAVASSIGIWLYDARTGKELDLLTKDMDWINSVSFSCDNRYLVSGSANGKVCLWDAITGKYIKAFVEYTNSVHSVCFSSDGRTLASGHSDSEGETQLGGVELWDVETNTHIKTLGGNISSVNSVCFNPNSQILASGRGKTYDYDHNEWQGGTVELWSVETGELIKRLFTYTGSVNSVTFGSENHLIAGGSEDGTVWIWDVKTGELIKRLQGLWYDAITSVSFSSDGSLLATGSVDSTVRLWDVETGKHLETLKGHWSAVSSVCFSPNSPYLVSGSENGTVRQSLVRPNVRGSLEFVLASGHTSSVKSISLSRDNCCVASGSTDGILRIWDIKTNTEIMNYIGHTDYITSVTFSPDSRFLASGGADNTVRLWNIEDRSDIKELGKYLWQLDEIGFMSEADSFKTVLSRTGLKSLTGHTDAVRSVSFSPNGHLLATGSGTVSFLGGTEDHTVRLWEAISGKNIRTLVGHNDAVASVSFSPDGLTLASGSCDNTIRLWNVKTGKHIKTLKGHTDHIWSICFNSNGQRLASCGREHIVRLWNVETGEHIKTLKGHTSHITSLSFSSDGHFLASGGHDRTICLWNIVTGKHIKTLKGHTSTVESVHFSSDGSTLATASRDGTVLLWETTPFLHQYPDVNPREIHGNWRAGWTLDFHTRDFHNRTELGELVYQLKYHDAKRYNDRSKIQQIAEVAAKFVKEEFAVDGYPILPYLKAVLPIPPSDQNRNFQPVTEVAKEIGRLLSVRVPTDYLTKVKQTTPLKNLPDVASKREQLRGVFVVQSQDLKDQCVLLIDDLYDSGTTLTEVTRVLYEQGAVRHVLVLTLTRTGTGNN